MSGWRERAAKRANKQRARKNEVPTVFVVEAKDDRAVPELRLPLAPPLLRALSFGPKSLDA